MTYFRIPLLDSAGDVRAYTLIDGEDLDWVTAHTWFFSNGYAVRHVRRHRGRGGAYKCRMHRELLGLARLATLQVDHINRDPLDNRRVNLRIVTPALNAQNKPSIPGSTSRFRGVCWDKRRQRWIAQAKLEGRQHHLGRYGTEEEAAEVARAWRLAHMPATVEDVAA